jgi:hypothetical protein
MMSAPVEEAFASGGGVEQWTVGPISHPGVDGRLVKIPRENIGWNRGSVIHDFREFVGSLIISARNAVGFEAMEFVLKASHLIAVGFHLGVAAA